MWRVQDQERSQTMYLSYSFQTWTCIFCFCIYILLHEKSLTAASYQEPSLQSFCDSLIREQDKLIHLGIINNADTSGKSLLPQQKEKSKPPKKHNFRNNKPNNKGLKPSQSDPSLKNDKGSKQKKRRLSVIAIFVGKIIMMNLSVSRRWHPWKQQWRSTTSS